MRGLMAKPSGDIIEQPIHLELPRGSHRARVLHLHPRRPQGSRRHRAEDRRLRLHDPQAGRRRPGRDHHGGGLRHASTASRSTPFTRATRRSSISRPASSAASPAKRSRIRSPTRRSSKAGEVIDEKASNAVVAARRRAAQDPLRAHLRKQARRLRQVLRPQPRDRPHGQARRGGRHHRRAVHRRARHAAHHAHVPHRRRRRRRVQAAHHQGQERRHGPLQRAQGRARTIDGNYIVLNKNGSVTRPRQGRPRTRAPQHRARLGHLRRGRRPRSRRATTFVQWDPYNVPILTEKAGKVEVPRHDRRRHREAGNGRGHRQRRQSSSSSTRKICIRRSSSSDEGGEVLASYSIPAGAARRRSTRATRSRGRHQLLAKTPRKIAKTKDITGGLPRVAELFEARRPKDACEIAKIDGIVDIGGTVRGKRKVHRQGCRDRRRGGASHPGQQAHHRLRRATS